MKNSHPRCSVLLADNSKCRSAVVRDQDGALSEFCAHHLKVNASPAPLLLAGEPLSADAEQELVASVSASTAASEATSSLEPPGESTPIASIRAVLRGDLSTASVADSIGELLLEGLRASKDVYTTCPHCSKRHPVSLPDLGTRITAARSLLEELEGKIAAQAKSSEDRVAEALAGKTRLENLSNDELTLLLIEQEGAEWDLREDVFEAARRVLADHPFQPERDAA